MHSTNTYQPNLDLFVNSLYLQVKMRLRKTVERRQDYLKSKNADVTPEAQELYRAIAKQLGVSRIYIYIYLYNLNCPKTVLNFNYSIFNIFLWQYNEVSWQGANIQILNEVTVSPPYRVDNVVSSSDNDKSCTYIKRIVRKTNSLSSANLKALSWITDKSVLHHETFGGSGKCAWCQLFVGIGFAHFLILIIK